jgi:peptide/nickel transport system substrate-binding protein
MRIKRLCLISIALALVMVLVSCAQISETTTIPPQSSTAANPQAAATTTPKATVAPMSTSLGEAPKSGGLLSLVTTSSVVQFDEAMTMNTTLGAFTHNEPAVGDWAKGPAGTGEADWTYSGNDRLRLKTGAIAESWEIPEVGHIIFHVRKGVTFGLNPNLEASRLVNGRELVADDFVKSLQRLCSEPRAYVKNSYPRLAASTVFKATDKYTVDITIPAAEFADGMSQWFDRNHIIAPEVAVKYGNVQRWELQVGTGPFLLTDYVDGSSATFARNPKYWMKDPVGPGKGNQLPYVDGVKLLIITDVSTAQAALRTAKIDMMRMETLDDADAVKTAVSDLKTNRYLEHATQCISMHLYNPALPTSDVRVRRALFMATDLDGVKKDLYRGDAETQAWPHPYLKEYASMFLPLKEAPETVQEIYKYSPDKAKALLKEAGYPNGFKCKIVCRNTIADVDFLSAVKSMWAKVGVDLEIQPKELGVYTSIWQSLNYEDMLYAGGMGIGGYYRCIAFDTPSYWNPSQVNDPMIQATKVKIYALYNDLKFDEVDAVFKDMMKYAMGQAWYIPRPLPYSYVLWWPWLKNYHGELNLGWAGAGWEWCPYVWVDQALKNKMTGR